MLVEESARAGFCALSTAISCHSEIAAPYILHIGTEEQTILVTENGNR